jgi:hypothetical protein
VKNTSWQNEKGFYGVKTKMFYKAETIAGTHLYWIGFLKLPVVKMALNCLYCASSVINWGNILGNNGFATAVFIYQNHRYFTM